MSNSLNLGEMEFKLTISDPKSGKSYQRSVKDADAKPFVGKRIGDSVKGEVINLTGYEFEVTGGSDNCGFPMRSGIKGIRQRILATKGVGIKGKNRWKKAQHGLFKRKTVAGSQIHDKISQINLKILKMGKASLEAPKEGEAKVEETPNEEAPKKEKPAEKKEEPKKEKAVKPKEEPKKKAKEAPKEEKK